jgi:hypothetical protein
LRIERQGPLEQGDRLVPVFPRRRLQPHGAAAEDVIARIRSLDRARRLRLDQFEVERRRDPAGDLVLQREQIADIAGEAFRP